ncbi:hypothetical protein Oweho_1676 [Owenweeksia hongkongensis DSM 17368]|uniref:Uncharacterized protein n=1 Tax=Owenweeksia hongkongensis (strain DSM 17368 / CIP 108786 / JCM 12287 / NRRL B-23963 / UST20020801) TaxID=926562 RepID=G8R024_OWEHD|nr:hypothetical protein [Owenweeksia hongkongensis]AEV32664.1 hypothetical protein Oweho_1676 [Owenweeksia hongkongensis DSM 17368]
MQEPYEKFLTGMYLQTRGFIPSIPLGQNVYPGDFFLIKNGEIIVLGNIFRKAIVDTETVEIEYNIKLDPANWVFSDGITKPYIGKEKGDNPFNGAFEISKLLIAFKDKGSYLFKGEAPLAVRIKNWSDIWQQLIIKLTQTVYSFRELYVVTHCATMDNWTLAVSSSKGAELEIATDSENVELADIFGDASSKLIQSKNLEFYHRQNSRKPTFFKAKKLVIKNEKLELLIAQLYNDSLHHSEWAENFFDRNFDTQSSNFPFNISSNYPLELLNMLHSNEFNPNSALQYFKWEDANLDDFEKLFSTH